MNTKIPSDPSPIEFVGADQDMSASSPLGRQVLETTLHEVQVQKAQGLRRRKQICACAAACLMIGAVALTTYLSVSSSSTGGSAAPGNSHPVLGTKMPLVPRVQSVQVERVRPREFKPIFVSTKPGISAERVERIDTDELMDLLASHGGGVIELADGTRVAALVD